MKWIDTARSCLISWHIRFKHPLEKSSNHID
jgi:hypothetical protein